MPPNESEVSAQTLSRLWPNRLHESNFLKNIFCSLGMHRWARLDLGGLHVDKNVRFCRWCSNVEVNGVIHGE